MEPRRVRILPSAWEMSKGLLRRTPSLRSMEGPDGGFEGPGFSLVPRGEEWYEASELYTVLGLREPRPFYLLLRQGEVVAVHLGEGGPKAAWVEPASPRRVLGAVQEGPRREEPPPPPPEKEPERPKKRVRVGWKPWEEEEVERLLARLLGLLGEEEFALEGVNPVLEHWGYEPGEVWDLLRRRGLLVARRGFWKLVRPGTVFSWGEQFG